MKGMLLKRITAGALALLMAGTALPAGSDFSGLFSGSVMTASAASAVTYTEYSWNGSALTASEKTITNYTVVTSSLKKMTSGNYVVTSNTTINDYISVEKDKTANLIVPKGVTLTCKQGIGCGYNKSNKTSALNIYGGGKIVATGKRLSAGIGGDNDETNGDITIHGTTIEATGGHTQQESAAGEEGGNLRKKSDGGGVNILGGTVTATGGFSLLNAEYG